MDCASATWVLNHPKNSDIHTAKVYYLFRYGFLQCVFLYLCIFSYRLVFKPTDFTFWRSHILTSHSFRPALVNKEHNISLVILLFVGTNIETDLNSSLSAVQELRHCFDSIELLAKFKCYGLDRLVLWSII